MGNLMIRDPYYLNVLPRISSHLSFHFVWSCWAFLDTAWWCMVSLVPDPRCAFSTFIKIPVTVMSANLFGKWSGTHGILAEHLPQSSFWAFLGWQAPENQKLKCWAENSRQRNVGLMANTPQDFFPCKCWNKSAKRIALLVFWLL